MTAALWRCFFGGCLLMSCAGALIIPDEFTSLVNLLYSKIPPIMKGHDSRVGVGFRFGDHADFQVVLEVGPQTNTKPLGPQESTDGNTKRQVQPYRPSKNEHITNTDGGRWLSAWRARFNPTPVDEEREGEIFVGEQVTEDPTQQESNIVYHLRQLYATSTKATPSLVEEADPTPLEVMNEEDTMRRTQRRRKDV